jgi:ABC-2 type transport system permease protein
VIRLIWRLQRRGLIGMAGFGMFYGVIQAAAYNSIAGTTAASRLALGQQMQALGRQFSLFLPLPQDVGNIAGFIQWRVYGALPILFGFWALMSASGGTRGDEDRGLVEQWLAAGVSRTHYVAIRFAVFIVTAIIAIGLTSAAIDLGAIGAGSALAVGPLLEVSLALLALTVVVYAVSFLLAQFVVSRGASAGVAALVVGLMYFVNSLSRSVDSLQPIARLMSPFYYYDLSRPLAAGGGLDRVATAGLFAAALVLAAASVGLMRFRDMGSGVIRLTPRQRPATTRPSANPLLRLPVLSMVYEQRTGMLAWGIGCGLLAAYLASIAPEMTQLVQSSSAFRFYLTLAGHGNPYLALTGIFWFGTFLPLLAVFSITQVSRWSSDDNEGRLEMVLSAPVSRGRVVAERALALLVRMAVVIAVSSTALLLGALSANLNLDISRLSVASSALIPFGLSFAAIGAVLASRIPRATIGILATLTFVSFLINQLGPLLRWPDWAVKLSIFSLYGTPLTSGVDWNGLLIMSAVTLAGFALAIVLMQRRDVGA